MVTMVTLAFRYNEGEKMSSCQVLQEEEIWINEGPGDDCFPEMKMQCQATERG
jgi:hypothetical protein